MEKIRGLLNDARAWFERLSTRERQMVLGTGGAVLAFVLFIILFSFSNSADGYRKRTDQKMAKLREVQALAASYREATQERQMVEQQLTGNNVRLMSYVEEKATQAGLTVPNMTPKNDVGIGDGKIVESSVELTFTDVDLRKLHDFLSMVERGPGVVKVKSLRLEPHDATETLTAWTTVATYKMKQ
ncbi:type II secretion system protein GspM [Vitiosangium sp. GDMCC 1.1324]|uniref:type II secretion system protein GspM n=1 Tax=Vitiosangium sp. (strain GDMCC 1.1324) TaxID=2138576 RepID=UPI000D345CD6|nr:type II secretion system protein GspM [Vitiosangium sp. GDMCC 1.1324]PTL80440.1 general secretion pathway protein M [Vitiosangium sp. GDMCC 1.1324]